MLDLSSVLVEILHEHRWVRSTSFIYSFICSFNEYSFKICYIPDTVLSARYSVVSKTALTLLEFISGAHDSPFLLFFKLFSEIGKIGVCQAGPGAKILVHRVQWEFILGSTVRGWEVR